MFDADETAPPTLAGDHTDDDGQVLDALVEPQPNKVPADQLPTETDDVPVAVKATPTRIMSATLSLQASWSPVLILPADTRRVSLHLWAASDTATDYARFSDDPGKLQTVGGSVLLFSGQDVSVDGHTGPVWFSCPDATGPVVVSALAVTE